MQNSNNSGKRAINKLREKEREKETKTLINLEKLENQVTFMTSV